MKSYRIAAIGGDGIGPEVIAAGLETDFGALRRIPAQPQRCAMGDGE